jgi:hypothetical protein
LPPTRHGKSELARLNRNRVFSLLYVAAYDIYDAHNAVFDKEGWFSTAESHIVIFDGLLINDA